MSTTTPLTGWIGEADRVLPIDSDSGTSVGGATTDEERGQRYDSPLVTRQRARSTRY